MQASGIVKTSPLVAQLNEMANALVNDCPDIWQMAREEATRILQKHAGVALEPDQVYWHRFGNAQSSAKSFTGWEHIGPPLESMSLPQLVMRRFSSNDQDNADLLQQMGGFYTAGRDAARFDESNEVRLLGQDVLTDFWTLDFPSAFQRSLDTFWKHRFDDFRLMAKVNFLARAKADYLSGGLSGHKLASLVQSMVGNLPEPYTLASLATNKTPGTDWQVRTFDIGGYIASDILRFVNAQGEQVLYICGELTAFHYFPTVYDLHYWTLQQCCTGLDSLARFQCHFHLSDYETRDSRTGLNSLIGLLLSTYGKGDHRLLNTVDRTIEGDIFNYLANQAKQRMVADARTATTSNAELRKQMWIGYLKAFAHVAGVIGALCWPVALAAVGADLASMGLSIDRAINGDDTASRKAGVRGAIESSIAAGMDLLAVFGSGPAGELKEEMAQLRAELDAGPFAATFHRPHVPVAESPIADTFYLPQDTPMANLLLDTSQPESEGIMQGVYRVDDKFYISIDDLPYAVRYEKQLGSWVIIDEKKPYAFFQQQPVRFTARGTWEPVPKLALRGGIKFFGKWPFGSSTTPRESSVLDTGYDIPQVSREPLEKYVSGRSDPRGLRPGYMAQDPKTNEALNTFKDLRQTLVRDSEAFFDSHALDARPPLPDIPSTSSPKTIIESVYEKAQGLVIGEAHTTIASKRFLIENMALLSKLKVRFLYLEHLMTDFHQADLDIFMATGKMPANLEAYLQYLDRQFAIKGEYNFLNLVKTAQLHHIHIQAIDCMASALRTGLTDLEGTLRAKMMNFYAHTVIQASQATPQKWVALVGEVHANTFENVPGLSELDNGVSIRITDVWPSDTVAISPDPGRVGPLKFNGPSYHVKNDFLLGKLPDVHATAEPVPHSASVIPSDLQKGLTTPGTFTLKLKADNSYALYHRSRDGLIHITPVMQDAGAFTLQTSRPGTFWSMINGRRFNNLAELSNALELHGMTRV